MGVVLRQGCMLVLLAMCVSVFALNASAGEDKLFYQKARKAIQSGDTDFSFLNYRHIWRNFPESTYYQDALFAVGEYHFLQNDYTGARRLLDEYVTRYPESESTLFAKVYLYRMALILGETAKAAVLGKEIVSDRQVSLVFRDFKEFFFESPLGREHRADFYIDYAEFFVQDGSVAKVTF